MDKFRFTVMQVYPDDNFSLADLNHMGEFGWNMTGTVQYEHPRMTEFYFSKKIEENE